MITINMFNNPLTNYDHQQVTRKATGIQTAAPSSHSPTTVSSESSGIDLHAAFSGVLTPVAEQPPSTNPPTAESVFGSNPWISNPTGNGPNGAYSFNSMYFATPETATKVASLLGGTVVQQNSLVNGDEFSQSQPNQMVRLANGSLVNAGLIAGFYTHGYPQSYIDQLLANVVKES